MGRGTPGNQGVTRADVGQHATTTCTGIRTVTGAEPELINWTSLRSAWYPPLMGVLSLRPLMVSMPRLDSESEDCKHSRLSSLPTSAESLVYSKEELGLQTMGWCLDRAGGFVCTPGRLAVALSYLECDASTTSTTSNGGSSLDEVEGSRGCHSSRD